MRMMQYLLVLLTAVQVSAQQQEVVFSVTADSRCVLRLRLIASERPFHEAYHLRITPSNSGSDTLVTPISEVNGRQVYVDVLGPTPDSSGLVLTLVDADSRIEKKLPAIRWVVLRSVPVAGYTLDDIDRTIMTGLSDIVEGARMVHKGETARPLTDLKRIDLKSEPYSRILSRQAFAAAGINRLEPMWLLSDEASGAQSILTYGFDDDGLATVQVVRSWYGPLRRLVYQRGAIVGVTPSGGESPALRVFDESSDSSRYARVIRYAWTDPDADSLADGRYVVQAMTIVSACVIPPKRWDPFPQSARLTRSVRLGFAPGYEGCASALHGDASWPFGTSLKASTSCEILATSKDASDNAWHFIGVRLPNDPAVRRLFGDYSSAETEQLVTGGWVAASALDTL